MGGLGIVETSTLEVGGLTGVAYNTFANSGEAPEEAAIAADNDLYIGGDLEVDGTIYGSVSGTINPGFTEGSVTFINSSGALAQDNAQFFWNDTNNLLGIGTATPVGKLHVTGAVTGKALTILNETGDQNILTASASGTTVASLDRSGNLSIEGAINDISGNLVLADTVDIGSATTGVRVATTGSISDIDGNIALNDNTDVTGVLTTSSYLQVGSATSTTYSRFGTGTSGHSLSGADDLLVTGDLEVDGVLYTDGGIDTALTAGSVVFAGTNGVLSEDNASLFFDDSTNKLGIGTATPVGKLHTTGAVTGKALAIFDETGNQDILVASASGATRFRLANDGALYAGYLLDISNSAYGIDPAGTSNFGGYRNS